MKKWTRLTLVCVAFILFASTLWAQGKSEIYNDHKVAAQEVLVKFRSPTLQNIGRALNAADADEVQGLGGVPGLFRFHSRSQNAEALVRLLSIFSDVEYAEPNYIVEATETTPNDPLYGNLWGMPKISAPLAWDLSTGSAANVVAVVDTGIDYAHPDLQANVWSAPAAFFVTIGGTLIQCSDHTHGFNAITSTCDPMDDNNHGTHVSGTIGAAANNGIGVVGVNWTTSLIGAKFLNATGSGTTANAINAIEFLIQAKTAAKANIRILSNSWGGGGYSQALLDEINKANTNDMLFVAAAGNSHSNNDRKPFYPASYSAPNVVAVAATDSNDQLASFSNYGAGSVHLGAPGVGIWSTVRNGGYSSFSGTSMATPHVSGAAALVLSRCALDTAGLKTNLLSNVDPVSALAGKTVTGGRLNVNKALLACSNPPPPVPADFSVSASPGSRTVNRGGTTTYTITVTPSGPFTGDVTLSLTPPSTAYTGKFQPAIVSGGSGTSTLTVTAGSTRGTYTLTVTGAGANGTPQHSTTVQLKVK